MRSLNPLDRIDSQIESKDFDKTYAATLSGCCLRLWCSIVANEDLETDSIVHAVKAFTQSDVDRELYVQRSDARSGSPSTGACCCCTRRSRASSKARTLVHK